MPGEFCIFFKLSNSGLVLGAGREVVGEAVAAAGIVKVKEGWVVGEFSVTEFEVASKEERFSCPLSLGILSSGILQSTRTLRGSV